MIIKSLYHCFALCLISILIGCSYYVPKRHVIENSENYFARKDNQLNGDKQCRNNDNQTTLNGNLIKLISWNHLAGCRQSLKKLVVFTHCNKQQADNAFIELTRDQDLILLQEAYLDHETTQLLEKLGKNYSWNMAVSFIADNKQDVPTGVLTAANAESLKTCQQRAYEPVAPTPKAILFTSYNVRNENHSEQLLVVNIHAILMGKQNYKNQLEQMAKRIDDHNGPVILAGDFNTLTPKSRDILKTITQQLDLTEAHISPVNDHRVRSVSSQYYDYIFYKKIHLLKAYSIDLEQTKNGKTSDHNPIFAEFKLVPDTIESQNNDSE